ncbi:MAG: hypothetical protein QXD54_05430, partial [Candidatus Aenigmatarchaeota archaeon]
MVYRRFKNLTKLALISGIFSVDIVRFNKIISTILIVLIFYLKGFSWSCKTHIFIAQEAGIKNPEITCFPDLIMKENESLLGPFHWHNASPNTVVTPDYIDQYQIIEGMYIKLNSPESRPIKIKVPDPAGVLYWKILDLYQKMQKESGWKYDYYLANIAHYIGDLSQPLHNFPYKDLPASDGKPYPEIGFWAEKNHWEFDTVLDPYLPLDKKTRKIFENMITSIKIHSIEDLK